MQFIDPEQTAAEQRARALAIVLPFLLKHGITQKAEEAFMLSLSTLVKMTKVAGAGIRPHIPELVMIMLESLASTESQSLNYMQMHASAGRTDYSEEKLERARMQISKSSPIWDTLDLSIRHTDDEVLDTLLPKLASMVRSGTGLPTRCGTARYIVLLGDSHRDALRKHSAKLLKSLQEAILYRSPTVRKAMAGALAKVGRVSDVDQMESCVKLVVSLYLQAEEDNVKRDAAAVCAKELAINAADALRGHLALLLPVVFMARHDSDEEVLEDTVTL